MSAEHTAGPWERVGHRQIASPSGIICEVWSGPSGIEQADANERLIAAAPELLERVRIALGYLQQGLPDTYLAASQLRAAIAKAMGAA